MDHKQRNNLRDHAGDDNRSNLTIHHNTVTNSDFDIELSKDQLLANQSKFEGNFPTFQMPKYVGSFSLNVKREYLDNLSQLRYLVIPPSAHLLPNRNLCWKVNLDLRKGVQHAIEKDGAEIRKRMLDDMLRWIVQERIFGNKDIFKPDQPNRLLESELVCFRMLIMQTPYERRKGWVIAASKFQGAIYLWDLQRMYGSDMVNISDPLAREMCLWGFKFEQYLCADSPSSVPNTEEELDTNGEFCCVVKTKLAGRSLLYGAEVDALRPDGQPPWGKSENPTLKSFVELKTTRQILNESQDINFRKNKLMKWWAQSFLVGVPSVICGYRNDCGLVSKMEEFELKKLPKMGMDYWKPEVMMNFCNQFLDFVQLAFQESSIREETLNPKAPTKVSQENSGDPTLHYIFEFDPKRKIVSRRLGSLGSDFSRNILPDWYIEAMSQPIG